MHVKEIRTEERLSVWLRGVNWHRGMSSFSKSSLSGKEETKQGLRRENRIQWRQNIKTVCLKHLVKKRIKTSVGARKEARPGRLFFSTHAFEEQGKEKWWREIFKVWTKE